MTIIKHILFYILLGLLATSCSIEKRRYTKGYHIEWNNNIAKHKTEKQQKEPTNSNIAILKSIDTTSNTSIELTDSKNIIVEAKKAQVVIEKKYFEKETDVKTEGPEILKTKINKAARKVKPFIKKQTASSRYSNDSTEFFTIILIVLASIAILIGLLGVISLTAQESVIYVILAILFIAFVAFLSWLGLGDLAFLVLDIMFLF